MRRATMLLMALIGTCLSAVAAEAIHSEPEVIQVGHWLEVRGRWSGSALFQAERVELMEPQRREVLIGTVRGRPHGDELLLLGQPVRLSEKTDFEGIDRKDLAGARVKVEGHYRRSDEFSAREISPRGAGRDRIAGRVDSVRRTAGGLELRLMRFTVLVPRELRVEHEVPWQELALAPEPTERLAEPEVSEDDLFGDGFPLARNLRLSAQLEVRTTAEENFDLDDEDREDRMDDEGSARLRLEWHPNPLISIRLEGRSRVRYRNDEEDGTSTEDGSRVGESFVHFHDPFSKGIDFAVGRIDFDDRREWIYDQNLDGVRMLGRVGRLRLDLAVSTSLSSADRRDLEATNYFAYVSNRSADRHLAGYVVHREFDLTIRERTTHLGARAIGEWLPSQESWIDLAYMAGELAGGETTGWGLDLGTTWEPEFARPFSFTVGYAFGSGDADSDRLGRTYRQTGLQDNNGKFAGVTSFRYYGELIDPELANLHVATLGWGVRFARRASLDLVGHYYRQDEARPRLVDAELDDRPDGVHSELGWEIDAVLGWRGRPDLDLEIVGAYFVPGTAFPDVDEALLAKVQVRYRI